MEGDPQMSLKTLAVRAAGAAMLGGFALGVAACGKLGALDQPAPLFGEKAKEDYAAKQRARTAQNPNAAAAPTPAADQPDPDADNAPRTTRDLKDPGQMNVPASQQPIDGVPDLMGPPPSMKPPGA